MMNITHDDLAEVVGFAATARLAAWYGGADDLCVPTATEPAGALARLIGEAGARRLANTWGGQVLTIPELTAYRDEVRRCRISRLVEHGLSTRDVAWLERISEHRVRRICDELARAGLIRSFGPVKRVRTGIVRRGAASGPLARQLQHVAAGARVAGQTVPASSEPSDAQRPSAPAGL